MVAIKKQMHWPWTKDLKDIFIGMLICASDQTQNSRQEQCVEVAQWETLPQDVKVKVPRCSSQ